MKNKHLITLLSVMLFTIQSMAQIVVKGTVTDNMGPLMGATVTVQGGTAKTVTDYDGKYSIKVPGKKSVLVFSYVGYVDAVELVDGRATLNVEMKEDTKMLEETVVIGYGTQAKSHLTGSISKMEGDKLVNAPVSDVTQALQGSMAGLSVNNNTSEVGVSPSIRVRGTGSVSANSDPLVIVDGFPVDGGLSTINASDIKSIEILKDAASAAIYGSRAANGVIMVTTKTGDSEKPKYSFKFYEGLKYAYKKHDLMTSQEWLDLLTQEEAMGGIPVLGQARASAYVEQNVGATDWQDEGLRTANITNVQFNISGGQKKTKYFVSTAYTKDEGIMEQNKMEKLNFRGKLDTYLADKVKFGFNLSGMYRKVERPRNNFIDFYRTPSFMPVRHNEFTTELTGYTGFVRGSHFNNIKTPTGSLDDEGNPAYETASPFQSSNNNPVSIMANTFYQNEQFQGMASLYFTVELAKNLTFKTSNGLNVRYTPISYYANKNATKDGDASTAYHRSALYVDLLSENTLTYKMKIGPKARRHTFDFLLGYTIEKTRDERLSISGTGFATDDIHTLNAATSFIIDGASNGNGAGTGTFRYPDVVLQSYLGRVNYDFMGRYLVSASLRLDRSSLFTKGNRDAWFPSVALGWRVSEEKFMKNVDIISNLKLRASYGVTGNNRIDYRAAQEMISSSNYVTGNGTGSLVNGMANTSSTLANPDITWEQTDEFNYGFDLGLWSNRVTLTLDAYYSVTRSLLFAQPMQSFTGFSYYWNNIGKVRNSGVEIGLNTHNIKKRNFTWDTDFNFSLSRNKLLELGGEEKMISQGERQECYIAEVGSPLIQYYGYKTNGVWNSQEEIDANPHFSSDVPGGLRIVDTNGDGTLSADDRVALGNPYPDFTWGITNTFQIGAFDISFLIQGVQGVTVFNGDVYYTETTKWNKAYTKNRWVSPEHPGDGKTPYLKNGYNLIFTDYPLQDASYACLRNLTVGYTMNNALTKRLKLDNVRFYVSGQNLIYIWSGDYKGINPESRMTSGAYSNALISGYQRGGFPLTSTITAGFDINF